MIRMDVIKKLNEIRLERNMSVYRLSEISCINQSTLANTFSRGTVPSIQNLEIICFALDITISQFFSSDEVNVQMTPNEVEFYQKYKKLPKDVKDSIDSVIDSVSKLINK
jgi:transcriptional regulator with XRE-family HTH domain